LYKDRVEAGFSINQYCHNLLLKIKPVPFQNTKN